MNRDKVCLWDLESVLWNITQVGQSRLDSLVALLLRVLFGLGEGRRAIEDPQRLDPLFEDFTVVGRQLEWIACQVEHLDTFQSF